MDLTIDRRNGRLSNLCNIVTLTIVGIILCMLAVESVYALSPASDGTKETTTNLTSMGGINNPQNISERPWLGILGVDLIQEVAKAYDLNTTQGILVVEVIPGSPAQKAGIHGGNQSIFINGTYVKLGDVILKTGNKNLSNFQDLLEVMSTKNVGDPIDMTIVQNGNIKQINLTLATKPDFFEYRDTMNGVEMNYPSDWEKQERANKYIDYSAGFYAPNEDNPGNNTTSPALLELSVTDFSQNVILEDLIKAWFNTTDDEASCNVVESNPNVTIFGMVAYLQKTACKDYSDTNIVSLMGNKVYEIVYRLENNKSGLYLPVINKMIDSFKINSTKVDSDSRNFTQFHTYANPIYGVNLQYSTNLKISKTSPSVEEDLFGYELFYSPFVNISQTVPNQVALSIVNISADSSLDQFTKKSLSMMNTSVDTPLEEFTTKYLDNYEHDGIVVLESKPTKFGDDYSAHSVIYNSTQPDFDETLKIMDIWTVKGDKAYVLSYATEAKYYDRNLPDMHKMLASFRITK